MTTKSDSLRCLRLDMASIFSNLGQISIIPPYKMSMTEFYKLYEGLYNDVEMKILPEMRPEWSKCFNYILSSIKPMTD